MNLNDPRTRRRLEQIQEVIAKEMRTEHQIAAAIHLSTRWVKPYLEYLIARRKARVAGWVPHGKNNAPVAAYKGTRGRSVPKPPADHRAACTRYRAKVRADPDLHDRHLALERARRYKPRPDPLMAWIPKTKQRVTD